MTKEEIEKKALEVYPKIVTFIINGTDEYDENMECREGYIKALTEIEELPKIPGWVARDAYEDVVNGVGLILHGSKPERGNEEWTAGTIMAHLPWNMFPELKWEDEPKQVELIIREV